MASVLTRVKFPTGVGIWHGPAENGPGRKYAGFMVLGFYGRLVLCFMGRQGRPV